MTGVVGMIQQPNGGGGRFAFGLRPNREPGDRVEGSVSRILFQPDESGGRILDTPGAHHFLQGPRPAFDRNLLQAPTGGS